jgi:hypothetical protein
VKRVLFVVELGGGFGHVRRMLPLARAAARAGRRPVFVTPNPSEVAGLVDDGFEVERAPVAPRARRAGETAADVARSFADILARAGFDDADVLERAIGAWRAVIDRLRPEAAVCELAPFFCLAARGVALPALVTGYGFVLPPPELARFPVLRASAGAAPDAGDAEDGLLEATNAAARRHGQAPLDALPALLRGDAHAVTGLGLLDPYAGVRRVAAVGPPDLDVRPLDDDSARAPEDLFGYLLGDAPGTLALLRALAASGASGRVFVRRATGHHRAAVAGSRLVWLERPEPPASALPRARLVVHHASMLTSEEAAVVGRPQILLPLYLEHLLTARTLAQAAGARVIRPATVPAAMTALVREAIADGGMTVAAGRFARTAARQLPATEVASRLLATVLP